MFKADLRSRTISTGLLLLLVLGGGMREAQAGLGIIITDTTVMPVGDPLTQYDFKLSLVAGNAILQNDFITLLNVPSYAGTSSYVFMSGGVDYSKAFSIIATPVGTTGSYNIELELTAAPPVSLTNPGTTNISIGDLFVTTTVNYPPPNNSPLFNPITYTTQTHLTSNNAINTGMSTTTPSAVVPEPASLALLTLGAASGLMMARGRRRPTCPA